MESKFKVADKVILIVGIDDEKIEGTIVDMEVVKGKYQYTMSKSGETPGVQVTFHNIQEKQLMDIK